MAAARSFEPLTARELAKLARIAAHDREARFERRPRWAVYRDRVLCVALCQGAAVHYLDPGHGIKDLDVWTFYAEHPEGPFPQRWRVKTDFGPSRFGRTPGERRFQGLRVDLFGRSLPEAPSADPVEALRRYLSTGRSASARRLAQKAVVLIDPSPRRGEVVWPP